MRDEEFISRFESCTLQSFHHQDHVKLAWLYLKASPPLEALSRFCEGIKRFAEAHGKSNLYHETITWAYVLLIHERMTRGREDDWEQFAQHNPDLMNWEDNVLKEYYRSETLSSDLARRVFLFPDKSVRPDESKRPSDQTPNPKS
jgi:hypothetical protein